MTAYYSRNTDLVFDTEFVFEVETWSLRRARVEVEMLLFHLKREHDPRVWRKMQGCV